MRLAFARGILWFFGAMIFLALTSSDKLSKMSYQDLSFELISFGFVVGGVVFGYTWYEHEKEERDLRREAAQRELEKKSEGCE